MYNRKIIKQKLCTVFTKKGNERDRNPQKIGYKEIFENEYFRMYIIVYSFINISNPIFDEDDIKILSCNRSIIWAFGDDVIDSSSQNQHCTNEENRVIAK